MRLRDKLFCLAIGPIYCLAVGFLLQFGSRSVLADAALLLLASALFTAWVMWWCSRDTRETSDAK